MKKTLSIIVAFAALTLLASCGGSTTNQNAGTSADTTAATGRDVACNVSTSDTVATQPATAANPSSLK